MAIELDQTSRATVNRFVVKCVVAILISLFVRSNYLLSAARCFELYALLMGLIAALTRQRYSAHSFNHWSKALWLAFISAGLQVRVPRDCLNEGRSAEIGLIRQMKVR